MSFSRALFKDPRFALVVASTALALFPLFVTAYFLPLYATSIGLSASTGALLLAAFNLASALGRVGWGLGEQIQATMRAALTLPPSTGADRIFGSVNSLIICLVMVSLTTLVIWPLSLTVAPLLVDPVTSCNRIGLTVLEYSTIYAVAAGFSSGGFFSLTTGCVSTFFGSKKLAVAFPLIVSFWAPG